MNSVIIEIKKKKKNVIKCFSGNIKKYQLNRKFYIHDGLYKNIEISI